MAGILLTPEQRSFLDQTASDSSNPFYRRALLLLSYDDGNPTRIVSRQVGLSPSRTRFWKRRFRLIGMRMFPEFEENPPQAIPPPSETTDVNADAIVSNPKLPFPEPTKSPGLLPDDTMAEAGRKILLFHFSHMLAHEEGTRLGDDIEDLHDMRVATRRMRSAFLVFGEAFEPKTTRFFEKRLRKLGRALGRVRDLDVLISNAKIFQQSQPDDLKEGLLPLLQSWQADLAQHRKDLLKLLDSPYYQRFKQDFNQFCQTPGLATNSKDATGFHAQLVRHIVPTLIYTRLATVMSFDARVLQATLEELHSLRIALKQLRYTLEFFREVLGTEALLIIEEIKSLQDHLGELNDAHVACGLLDVFLKRFEQQQTQRPLLERTSPVGVVDYQAYCFSIRHQKMLSFPAHWEQFKRNELRQLLAQAISVL